MNTWTKSPYIQEKYQQTSEPLNLDNVRFSPVRRSLKRDEFLWQTSLTSNRPLCFSNEQQVMAHIVLSLHDKTIFQHEHKSLFNKAIELTLSLGEKDKWNALNSIKQLLLKTVDEEIGDNKQQGEACRCLARIYRLEDDLRTSFKYFWKKTLFLSKDKVMDYTGVSKLLGFCARANLEDEYNKIVILYFDQITSRFPEHAKNKLERIERTKGSHRLLNDIVKSEEGGLAKLELIANVCLENSQVMLGAHFARIAVQNKSSDPVSNVLYSWYLVRKDHRKGAPYNMYLMSNVTKGVEKVVSDSKCVQRLKAETLARIGIIYLEEGMHEQTCNHFTTACKVLGRLDSERFIKYITSAIQTLTDTGRCPEAFGLCKTYLSNSRFNIDILKLAKASHDRSQDTLFTADYQQLVDICYSLGEITLDETKHLSVADSQHLLLLPIINETKFTALLRKYKDVRAC